MLIALLLLSSTSTVAPATDVLAQIHAGKLLCTSPDPATKTCSAIDSFAPGKDGTVFDTGEVLMSPNQPITLETSSVTQINGSMFCGTMELADLQKGKVRVEGTPLPPEKNEEVVSKITDKLAPLAGRKVCESLRIEDGHLIRYGDVERVDLPLPGKPASWISPGDGYRVAPR